MAKSEDLQEKIEDPQYYHVYVKTGHNPLELPVTLELSDDAGKKATLELNNLDIDDFKVGALDYFNVSGTLLKNINSGAIIGGPTGNDYWTLDWIYVEFHGSQKASFLTNKGSSSTPYLPNSVTLRAGRNELIRISLPKTDQTIFFN
jgi:hypothetical protein